MGSKIVYCFYVVVIVNWSSTFWKFRIEAGTFGNFGEESPFFEDCLTNLLRTLYVLPYRVRKCLIKFWRKFHFDGGNEGGEREYYLAGIVLQGHKRHRPKPKTLVNIYQVFVLIYQTSPPYYTRPHIKLIFQKWKCTTIDNFSFLNYGAKYAGTAYHTIHININHRSEKETII